VSSGIISLTDTVRSNLQHIPLSSSIIKDLEDARKAGLASLAYYYFDFKDSQKQDRRGLLSSLLLQLSARSDVFCEILGQMHLTYDEGSRQPSESDLIDCLREMLSVHGQGKVYIILDALDECSNNSGMPTSREEVMTLLKNLTSLRLPHVHIWVNLRRRVLHTRIEEEPRTPLSYAVLYGFDHLVRYLVITRRHDPNAPDPDSCTPLQMAVRKKNHVMAQFLLDHGADPNCRDRQNRALLHEAAVKGYLDVAQLLLNSGADMTALDDVGASPLITAIKCENLDVLRLLLQQGAEVNTRDAMERRPYT
jgi:hypothetical protein